MCAAGQGLSPPRGGRRSPWALLLLVSAFCSASAQRNVVAIVDESLAEAGAWLAAGVASAEAATGEAVALQVFAISIEDETSAENQLCSALYNGVAAVLDVTAGGWEYGRSTANRLGVPYVHGQVSIAPQVRAVDQLLESRNATDAALIFSGEDELDQALYYLVGGSSVRVIVLVGLGSNSSAALRRMRPAPAYYVLFGTAPECAELFDQAVQQGFVTRDARWTVAITGTDPSFRAQTVPSATTVTVMSPDPVNCCVAQRLTAGCDCSGVVAPEVLIKNLVLTLTEALKEGNFPDVKGECSSLPQQEPPTLAFEEAFKKALSTWEGATWHEEDQMVTFRSQFRYEAVQGAGGGTTSIGTWSSVSGIALEPHFESTPVKRFFRVGSVESRPWFYKEDGTDGVTYEGYAGYCVELALRLAAMMEFDFTFVTPPDGKFGAKTSNGTWNGLVADLANGETDVVVAPLTMTSEREEVIDFVTPYFDQSGISIVIRKRERQENLFKFMTVLKPEVWGSIVAALVITGVMLWLLDRYSPYSGQNNADKYPENCRKFTLKESFWFALTSFTPQGGGEAPKALSGRTLVAAYWLFVVLMLATFTANLAAFLTVERMQSPVQSLEALARQAKIKFTTTRDTSTYEYFFNMARAEDELFRVWKELTLNSTTDQSKYRVWDYPIKEQYTHILQVIEDTGPLATAQEAFQMVLDNKDGEFAFIHDAAQIRYELYHSCLLQEVGEPFAEQPYAIAVQQGSYLQEEMSRAILELQKERYFEALLAKFWNSSARGYCPNDDDSEGITLQSLGGVFIATLIGLVLALVALGVEVLYNKRGGAGSGSAVQDISVKPPVKVRNFDSGMTTPLDREKISRISVTPLY